MSHVVDDIPHLTSNMAHHSMAQIYPNISLLFDDKDSTIETKQILMKEIIYNIKNPTFEFTEKNLPFYMELLSFNIIRTLPTPSISFDPDEDRPNYNKNWDYLELLYELLCNIIDAPIPPKLIKQFITRKYCTELIKLTKTEDPRERRMVGKILYKIYAKFKSLRFYILDEFNYIFLEYIEKNDLNYPYGISELLEIFSSIIKGFTIPLQKNHIKLFLKILLPLFKYSLMYYHQELLLCIINYIEKEFNLGIIILNYLLKYWPKKCTPKQILYLNTIEEILENISINYLNENIKIKLAKHFNNCLKSIHFQIAERTLFLWNSTKLINYSILNPNHTKIILPIIFPSLMYAFKQHWNITVRMLAHSVLEMYTKHDQVTYQHCLRIYKSTHTI